MNGFCWKEDDETRNSERTESEEDSTLINQRIKLKETAYFVLGKSWPDDVQTQSEYRNEKRGLVSYTVLHFLTLKFCRSISRRGHRHVDRMSVQKYKTDAGFHYGRVEEPYE
jgi:hypothetical protein